MSDDTPAPEAPMAPLVPFTEAEIIEKARKVITGEFMLADARDPDWGSSLALMLSAMKEWPANTSTLFLVPMHAHQNMHWLNGRVPGLVISCESVPMESAQPLVNKIREFWERLSTQMWYPKNVVAYYLFLASVIGLFVGLVGCVIVGALLLGGWE